ncbi:TPA: ABC transporter substrate-binding protein [Candidatus Bipolaricaulota bacterium]|nr:ABC transporter substrate-binding protein [Candidatus Bipolaricaulota bacterium]
MRRFVSLMILVFLAVGLIIGLGAGEAAQVIGKVVIGLDAPPRTMNPHGSGADANMSMMSNIFEGLVQRDVNGEIKPALATSWERIDLYTWRFTLRQGVKFHNGNDFTWEDVAFSFERLRDPEVSEFVYWGEIVESVEPVGGDPWTIDIKTTEPIPYFVDNSHQVPFIMDKESTETRSVAEVAAHPIGTGPYKFVEWVKGAYLKLEANEDYWGGPPPVKYVEFREIVDPSTRLAAIETGEVDIIQKVPLELFDRATANPDLEVITRPARRAMFLGLRHTPGFPGSDIRVRRAIYMAIDVEELIETIMFGHATPAAQINDPPTLGYNPEIKRLPYDPEEAKRLLAEAGYPDGFDITLKCPTDRYVMDEETAEAVAKYLAKVGIRVELDCKPKAVFFPEVRAREVDFYYIGWFDGAYSLIRTFFKLVHSYDPERGYGEWNGGEFSDPLVDRLIEESVEIVDPELYEEWSQLVNRVAMEKIAYIPLFYLEDSYAVRKDAGIKFTPRPDTWMTIKDVISP